MDKLSRKERAVQESLGIKPDITICAECANFGGRIGRYAGKCCASPAEDKRDRVTGKVMYWRGGRGYTASKAYKYKEAADINQGDFSCLKFTYNTRNWRQSTWRFLKHNWRGMLITWAIIFCVPLLVQIWFISSITVKGH